MSNAKLGVEADQVRTDAELSARVALSVVVEPMDTKLAPVIRELGAARAWAAISSNAGGHFDRCQPRVQALDLEQVLWNTHQAGARLLFAGLPGWPPGLDDLEFAPFTLWARGAMADVDWMRSVAVVGSRAATSYGLHVAGEFGYDLASSGYLVVSGAAFGIDAAAHRGALAAEVPTIAILAGGVDRPYPLAHSQLLDQIRATGLVLSEAPPGASPRRERFLARNRLIAAVTAGTVVVEAGLRSGALSSAGHAERLGRVLAAVPGPVTSAASAGTNAWIRDGRAVLVSSAAQCVELVAPIGEGLLAPERDELTLVYDDLAEVPRRVFESLPKLRATTVDRLAVIAGVSGQEVMAALGSLELTGRVERSAGGWRRRPQDAPG
ncbi:DNA protecting protein DprA [Branchiibius hedensis]|uniref:DNA protecting protein DprA n=1 Tax=Branchiibius hedensis TaxID=672460 RepID=A0A2Y8ZTT3_9MICO|nr:DNA-processing protein DprA [Branchiibius hedensis]PWJ25865.1 DNA protecting protein DprA [Branchiibius hedensis]SSA34678.1 DNA protecting protein DprA [Branchiibius hedensis]